MRIANILYYRRQIKPEKICMFLQTHGERSRWREVNFSLEINCEVKI